jgi:hypothetical protein
MRNKINILPIYVTALENAIVHGLFPHKLQQPLPPFCVQVTIVTVGEAVGTSVGFGVGLPGR